MLKSAACLSRSSCRSAPGPASTQLDRSFRAAEVLTASEAAEVCGVTPETIRRWCEAADGMDSAARLLDRLYVACRLPALLRLDTARWRSGTGTNV